MRLFMMLGNKLIFDTERYSTPLHYCPLACISDGVKTRLGTVRTPYEHFYAWRRVNEGDAVSTLPLQKQKL